MVYWTIVILRSGMKVLSLLLIYSSLLALDETQTKFTYLMEEQGESVVQTAGDGLVSSGNTISVGAGTGISSSGTTISINESADIAWTGNHTFDGTAMKTNGQIKQMKISRLQTDTAIPTSIAQFGPTFNITVGSGQIIKFYIFITIAEETPSAMRYFHVEGNRDGTSNVFFRINKFLVQIGTGAETVTLSSVVFENPGAGSYTYTFRWNVASSGPSALADSSWIAYEIIDLSSFTDTSESW